MGSGGSQKIFVTVKSYSKRGQLLKRPDLQTLAESRDLDELVTRIKNTKYLEAVNAVTKPYTAEKLEMALRANLADNQFKIAKASGNSKILDAFFQKFIVSNLKLILKGKILGKSQEEISAYFNMHAEELAKQRDTVVKALVAKDLEEAVSSLGSSPFNAEIQKAVELYNETKNIQAFDIYFDKMLYQNISRALRSENDQDISHIYGMEIDFYNIMSIIRGKFWGLDDERIQDLTITATVNIPNQVMDRMMAAESVKDALDELSTTRYKNLIPETEDEVEVIAEFEHAFEMTYYNSINGAFSKMFSFATVIGISKLIGYEVRNIGAIAFAVEQNIPVETTMSKLIIKEAE
ncbi:V-type ATPase subunit [Candidatus Nitrosopelagicus sp.]|nr:V-type ATPase subunit [Candidatus Nitrosopelagicus sp.]